MGYPVEIFETLYGFHEFLRDTRNIKPARQASADELAGKVSDIGVALCRIIQAARTYHRVVTDELIWEMPGVAEQHAESLGFRGKRTYQECLAQAYAFLEMELADVGGY